jgi:hypothetical protein
MAKGRKSRRRKNKYKGGEKKKNIICVGVLRYNSLYTISFLVFFFFFWRCAWW